MAAAATAATAGYSAASLARRCTVLRFSCRQGTSTLPSSSSSLPSISPIPRPLRSLRLSTDPSPFSLCFRRGPLVLSSMLPIHSATASARLVSKLPKEASTCVEGRFANYLSPI